jgi:hypothetical protein
MAERSIPDMTIATRRSLSGSWTAPAAVALRFLDGTRGARPA